MKILLIENKLQDAILIRQMIDQIPEMPFQVTHTVSAGEASAILDQETFEIIMLNLHLPDAQGLSALHTLREKRPQTPIIALTDLNEEKLVREALSQGAQDCIFKDQLNTKMCSRIFRYALEKKKGAQALSDSEQYNRNLFYLSPIGLALCRMDGTLVDVNPAYAGIIGCTVEETMDMTYWQITPQKYAEEEKKQLESLLRTGRYGPYEKEYIHKDGHLVPVRLSGLIIEKEGEKCIWSSVEDITERKEAEKALLSKNKELLRSEAEREQLELFAYVASHDLQEPLQKIIGFGDLLADHSKEKLDAKGRDYLGRIQNAALRMSRLLEDLLKLSRMVLISEPFQMVSLDGLLREVLGDLELRIIESKASIDYSPGMPSVYGEKVKLHQLLLNLLSNALKFSKDGVAPAVTIRSSLIGRDFAEIRIQDNGIGFDPENLERIFKPFERLHPRGKYEGTGMGLAICQKIVKHHEGRITAQSFPDQGATFILTLPTHDGKRDL